MTIQRTKAKRRKIKNFIAIFVICSFGLNSACVTASAISFNQVKHFTTKLGIASFVVSVGTYAQNTYQNLTNWCQSDSKMQDHLDKMDAKMAEKKEQAWGPDHYNAQASKEYWALLGSRNKTKEVKSNLDNQFFNQSLKDAGGFVKGVAIDKAVGAILPSQLVRASQAAGKNMSSETAGVLVNLTKSTYDVVTGAVKNFSSSGGGNIDNEISTTLDASSESSESYSGYTESSESSDSYDGPSFNSYDDPADSGGDYDINNIRAGIATKPQTRQSREYSSQIFQQQVKQEQARKMQALGQALGAIAGSIQANQNRRGSHGVQRKQPCNDGH